MKRTCRDKENMVGFYHTVFGVDIAPLHNRQQISLHTLFAGILTALRLGADGNFVNLVDKNDPAVLCPLQRFAFDRFKIQQFLTRLAFERLFGIFDFHLFFDTLGTGREYLHEALLHFDHLRRHRSIADLSHTPAHFDLDLQIVQFPVAQFLAHLLETAFVIFLFALTRTRRQRRQEFFNNLLFDIVVNRAFILLFMLRFDQIDRRHDQISDHRLHIAPDKTDFGIFTRFDFDKRQVHHLRQSSGDLRFTYTRRTDHQNIFRTDLLLHLRIELHPAVTVAQCDTDRLFRLKLPDNILIQIRDNLFWCHIHEASSLVNVNVLILSLV